MSHTRLLLPIIIGFASVLTLASQHYTGPPVCPTTGCPTALLRSGFPLPVYINSQDSSPTSGWGVLGPEDFAFEMFAGNVFLYSLMLWGLWLVVRHSIARVRRPKRYGVY